MYAAGIGRAAERFWSETYVERKNGDSTKCVRNPGKPGFCIAKRSKKPPKIKNHLKNT